MSKQTEILDDLNSIKENHLQVCIFGCGNLGKGGGYDILKFLGISIDYYSDNDSNLWGKKIKENIECIPPKELQYKKNVACFVMVAFNFYEEIISQLRQYDIRIIITSFELYTLDIVVDSFIQRCIEESRMTAEKGVPVKESEFVYRKIRNVNHKQYVAYTCITGDYDSVNEPEVCSKDCDYYLISDKKPPKLKVYQWIDVNELVPKSVKDNRRKNRFCKINAPYIFSEYKYSVYVDGNTQITGDVKKYISKIGKSGIAAYPHPGGLSCLYELSMRVLICKLEDKNKIFQQMYIYYKEGMPRNYGMFECGILVRDNNNMICQKVMSDWWMEVFNHSFRDQLSFTYCLWKNGLKVEDVGILGENRRNSPDFNVFAIHHYINEKWVGES